MKRSALVSSVAACFCLGLAAPALAADVQTGSVNNSASEKNDSAIPVWRERQIAAAQPVTSKNIPFRPEELLGTEVRNPQNEALGSVENLVMSPATDKVAYLVIALDRKSRDRRYKRPGPIRRLQDNSGRELARARYHQGRLGSRPPG